MLSARLTAKCLITHMNIQMQREREKERETRTDLFRCTNHSTAQVAIMTFIKGDLEIKQIFIVFFQVVVPH